MISCRWIPCTIAALGAGLAAVVWTPARGAAQATGALVVEAGGARSFPPSGEGDAPASYGLAGVRLEGQGGPLAGWASVTGGKDLGGDGADFASLLLAGEAWRRGPGPDVGVGLTADAFVVAEPYPYEAAAAEGSVMSRIGEGSLSLLLRGTGGVGRSAVEVSAGTRREPRRRSVETDLWRAGGDAEVRWVGPSVALEVGGGVHGSAGGTFRQAVARVTGVGARALVQLELAAWDTPLGTTWTGGVSLQVPLGGGWSLAAGGGRTAPEPLTLVESGRQGGATVGWRVLEMGGGPVGLYEVVEPAPAAGGPATVRFRVEREGAGSVALMGDFTGWEPVEMERGDGGWTVEAEVVAGTHHFGFMVDGEEWFVPEGLPGNVPDEWGRTNATLVVP